jgi:hypothetical protein
MINKFPYLKQEDREQVYLWLESQRHKYMSDHHMYRAHNNITSAEKCNSQASGIASIQLHIKYHMKIADEELLEEHE